MPPTVTVSRMVACILKKDAPVSVIEIPSADHFNVLAPATELIADAVARES